MEKIKWGIIGCGDVTEVKSGPAFGKVDGSELVAVMRRNGDKARNYAIRHNVPKWYDNADELISDKEVNAIYVATPPGSHAEYTIRALRAGKPVYVEKPMAITYQECQDMINESARLGVPLFVAYYRRLLPGFVTIKKLIDEQVIGKPLFFQIKYFTTAQKADYQSPLPWRVIPELSGGGYLYDMGSHQLDFIDYLLGPIEEVKALTTNQRKLYQPEDFISSGFTLQSGVAGNGVWSFGAPEHATEDTIEIVGEEGKINFSCFGFTPTRLTIGNQTTFVDNPRPQHVQQPLIESIVNELRGIGKCPSTGVSATRTNKVLAMIAGEYSKTDTK